MDKFNIILIVLIFTSLVVIISIFGKNLKNFKQAEKSSKLRDEIGKRSKGKSKFSFSFLFSKISDFFVWIAETIVSNAGKALKAAHSGLLEMKANRGNKNVSQGSQDFNNSFEEKQEIVSQSFDFQERMPEKRKRIASLRDKFAKTKNSIKLSKRGSDRIAQNEVVSKERESSVKAIDFSAENSKNMKLKDFFQSSDLNAQKMEDIAKNNYFEQGFENEEADSFKRTRLEKEEGFFSKLNPFKKTPQIKERKILSEESFNEFSAGVISVKKESMDKERELFMKDVVRTKHGSKPEIKDDDDLGIDRQILEKRILQKIASNPKDIESYRQLGELYIKMENFDDAHSAYKFILKISARDVDASRKLEKIKLLKRLK
jgi:hypothetical protein